MWSVDKEVNDICNLTTGSRPFSFFMFTTKDGDILVKKILNILSHRNIFIAILKLELIVKSLSVPSVQNLLKSY